MAKNKVVGVNMEAKMADDLTKRAKKMGISKATYCRIILKRWLDSNEKLTLSE